MNGPEPGLEILPGLTLLRRLGRGGMGEAWLARDAELGAEVVAKLLPGDAPPERLALLRREARLVRKLKHPRIVPVFGFRAGERFCAVTLRHMPGGDADALRGAPPAEIVRLGRDVADALAYLHELGVVHRDVKASNVLLDEAGRAHLADFGIASVAAGDEDGIVLRGGGSRASMSPQQRAGAPPLPADDLYALGALLIDLLSGQAPRGEAGGPASLPAELPIPERLRALVAALVAPLPEARPRSAAAVRDELEAVLAELPGAAARPVPDLVRLQPPPRIGDPMSAPPRPGAGLEGQLWTGRREPIGRGPLVLLGGLLLVALAAVVWRPRWATPPPRDAPAAAPTPSPQAAGPQPAEAPVAAGTAPGRAQPPEPDPEPAAVEPPSRRVQAAPAAPVAEPEPEPTEVAAPAPEPTPDPEQEARTLASHREQAARLEAREEWSLALQQYSAALAIDPYVTFAVEGSERAGKRARLDEALDFHLQRPERLSATAVAREAEALLERARGIEPRGPALAARIGALEAALARARTPVAVVLESDGLTELTLSRVGPLGTLTRRSLELMPGSYTVTGSRPGYRDVRRQFNVAAGAPGPVVSLRCEEAL